MNEVKICKKCGRELPLTEKYYPKDKGCKDGFRNVCRECQTGHSSGFLKDDYKRPSKWTDDDINLLKEKYKYYTNIELRDMFFPYRSVQAVKSKSTSLNLGSKTIETYRRMHEEQMNGKFIDNICSFSDRMKKQVSQTKKEYFKTHDGSRKGKGISDIQRQLMKDRSVGRWDGDKNPRHLHPLNGSENGRWKGGINPTYVELRSETKEWQNESMKFCNYKCVVSGGLFDDIHHTVAFRDIVDEAFLNCDIDVREKVMDYSEDEFGKLKIETKNLHDLYGYGACVNKKIHKLFHDEYGYTKFTVNDFLDFVYRIDCGDFDKWFDVNNISININYNYVDYLENVIANRKIID